MAPKKASTSKASAAAAPAKSKKAAAPSPSSAGQKRSREDKAVIAPASSSASAPKKAKAENSTTTDVLQKKTKKSSVVVSQPESASKKPAVKRAAATTTKSSSPSSSKMSTSSKKATSKSPLTSQKPVVSDAEEEEEEDQDDDDDEGLDSEGEAEILKGLSSGDSEDDDDDDDDDEEANEEDDANSSDEEAEDSASLKKHRQIETLKLPSSKDEEAVKQRLDKLAKRRQAAPAQNVDTAVLFVGHLPKHFTEGPLRAYFSQFGTITRLRLSRNKKTGASKHYAFLEFGDDEVAKIVQETMDNYLILGQLLKVKAMDKDEIHPKLWVGANRAFRKVPEGRLARVQHDNPKTPEQKERVERKLLERQDKKRKALKEAGYDYDFDGYTKQGKSVKA